MQQYHYEAMYIIDPNQPEETIQAIIAKYAEVITRSGGVIEDTDRWDPRRLAYEIDGRREGIYIVLNFTGTAAVRNELDRIFRISDDILRHMVVRPDKRADRTPSKTRAYENERREREMAARQASMPQHAEPMPPQVITDLPGQPGDASLDTPISSASFEDDENTDVPNVVDAEEGASETEENAEA